LRGPFDIEILQAAKEVRAGRGALVDIFERIETFFRRLEAYTQVPSSQGMVDTITAIMVEVISILAIATKEMKQGKISKSFLVYSLVAVDRNIFREVFKEVVRKDRYRRCVEEARQTDARGGSNGHRATPADHT
jgi:hypothetical protein